MKKIRLFHPDEMVENIYALTPQALAGRGIRGVIFDIDNTVAPYEVETPTAQMEEYFSSLRDAGIQLAFVSNNRGDRVTVFNQSLGFFYVCKAGKPSPKGVRKCIAHFDLPKEQVLAVCLAAHRAGIRFVMVPPIQAAESRFFRFKRFLERPFVRAFKKRAAGKEQKWDRF